MPLENQNFTLLEGDHKKVIYAVEGVDMRDAEQIIWSCGLIEKTKLDMDIEEKKVSFDINSNETEGLHGRYKHTLQIVDNIGNVSTLATGIMLVKQFE